MTKITTDHPDAHRILAYVDGRLQETEIDDIERLISHDSDAADLLQLFKKSALPFAEAFDEITVDSEFLNKAVNKQPKPFWKNRNGRIVAVLLLGLFGGWLGSELQYRISHQEPPDWITQVANYQLLYVRDTVRDAQTSDHAALQDKLTKALGSDFNIPNLANHDLKFMRGQILKVDGAPLIQLVYLPANGSPVAVCITPRTEAGNKPEKGIENGLSYVQWSTQELSYVIMGNIGEQPLYTAALEAIRQI